MRENVGNWDRILRSIAGPGLLALGYFGMRGRQGRLRPFPRTRSR